MNRPIASSFTLAVTLAASVVLSAACTSQTNFVGNADGGAGTDASNANLPEIDASDLGGKCSGFGTSVGDTAAFPTDRCAAGMCLVDARSGLELYCSADCANARCPEGYTCETTSVSAKKVCFKDPNAKPKASDAGTAGDYRDQKLVGYLSRYDTSTRIALREFADTTRTKSDLVVLMLSGSWEQYSAKFLDDDVPSTWSRVTFVNVLVQGAGQSDANNSDVIAWHRLHPGFNMLLDPGLKTLAPVLDGGLDALPIFIGLDAKTLEPLGQVAGVGDMSTTLETWRKALPN